MSDLKDFLKRNSKDTEIYEGNINKKPHGKLITIIKSMPTEFWGLFFWKRGGKLYVELYDNKDFNQLFQIADKRVNGGFWERAGCSLNAKDFLDCVACLGEEKVKELIKGLKE